MAAMALPAEFVISPVATAVEGLVSSWSSEQEVNIPMPNRPMNEYFKIAFILFVLNYN
jgi:hypothetical protein